MVELGLNNSYFMFRDKYYQQTFGTAMGSPLSPILADYVMEDLLDTVITKLNFTIPVLKKYVDDLFLVLPKPLVEHTLNIFNQFNQHLQFTMEIESAKKITPSELFEQQKHVIFQNLRRNDYPSALINRLMNRIKTELITGQQHHGHCQHHHHHCQRQHQLNLKTNRHHCKYHHQPQHRHRQSKQQHRRSTRS
ncbi:uncharacterized protein LOC134203846, partial [Armigeres subalbatus]|uniref:uncharacterized protein LOC134203846 n=1 Tax=Armigeres subalbatus TaxID=124917 RepID=UPI002ECFC334